VQNQERKNHNRKLVFTYSTYVHRLDNLSWTKDNLGVCHNSNQGGATRDLRLSNTATSVLAYYNCKVISIGKIQSKAYVKELKSKWLRIKTN